ncbi:MAG: glycosyltransferase [Candidatus Omnitrophota bacterium]
MTVSIIIAVKAYCGNLKECVSECLKLSLGSEDYEILILPDSFFSKEGVFSSLNINIIPTKNIAPPAKRDLGAKFAKGEILAFLDDDAYPAKEWLKEAIKIFEEDENIGCVCGPAITPQSDSLRQKASGLTYSSLFVSGNHSFRYIPKSRRGVFDFPSCNFLIRKELFEKIGGFDKPYWPGEDTFLCLKVLETGKKMVYDPKVLVYHHHRRALFKKHLGQIKNYALHRGYFAKKYPETSFKIEYFIPSVFTSGVIAGGILSLFSSLIRALYLFLLFLYFIAIDLNSYLLSWKEKESFLNKIKLKFLTISGISLTHIIYGTYFIKGLFASKMPEEE